jgi:hypothetical protein
LARLASEAASAGKLIDHLDQAVLAKAFRGAWCHKTRTMNLRAYSWSASGGSGRRRADRAAGMDVRRRYASAEAWSSMMAVDERNSAHQSNPAEGRGLCRDSASPPRPTVTTDYDERKVCANSGPNKQRASSQSRCQGRERSPGPRFDLGALRCQHPDGFRPRTSRHLRLGPCSR